MIRKVFRAILDFYTLSACSWNRTHRGNLSFVRAGVALRLYRCDRCQGGYLENLGERLFVGPRVFADCDKDLAEMTADYAPLPEPTEGEA